MARGAQLMSLSLLCCFCFLENSWTFLMANSAFKVNEQNSWWKGHNEGCNKFYDTGVADSQLITGFLAFPLLTSACLTSNLACDIVLFLHILLIHVVSQHTCVNWVLCFKCPLLPGVFWITVVPVFFWIQFLTCACLLVSWWLYSKHNVCTALDLQSGCPVCWVSMALAALADCFWVFHLLWGVSDLEAACCSLLPCVPLR